MAGRTSRHKRLEDSKASYESFVNAVQLGDVQGLKEILNLGEVNPNVRISGDPSRQTPLHVAVRNNQAIVVQTLLFQSRILVNVDAEDAKGSRPIWLAVKQGSGEIAKALLDRQCEVNYVDEVSGCTPLHCAVVRDDVKMAQLLIRHGADVNFSQVKFSASKETPLMRAVQLNHVEMCKVLTEAGCHVNTKTSMGVTALHYAVASRRYDICHFLLEKGAEVHAETNHGITPLTIAVDHQNSAMVKTLASFGYNLNAEYRWGETPLEHAIRIHSEKCAVSLVHWGCGLKTTRGQPSYFFVAMSESLIKLAKLILEVRPMFSQDAWVRAEQWPLALYRKPDVCQWLMKKAKKPPRLKALCRGKVLQLLGLRPQQKLETLGLPLCIQSYLGLKRHFRPSFSRMSSLDKPDCPYHCPVLCRQLMCPPLDISSDEF